MSWNTSSCLSALKQAKKNQPNKKTPKNLSYHTEQANENIPQTKKENI